MTRDEAATVIIARVLANEGAVGQVPGESWITRWGQTPSWLETFGFPVPTSIAEAAQNYQTFLVRTKLIGICAFADDLAFCVVDFAVNAGHQTAIRWLQSALRLKADGIWGPETQTAVDCADRRAIARSVLAARVRFICGLVAEKPAKYLDKLEGWGNRVAAQIEGLA